MNCLSRSAREGDGANMRTGKFPLTLSAVALLATPAAAGRLNDLYDAAKQCSLEAAARYAVASTETAEAVLGAAFEICRKQWDLTSNAIFEYASVKHPISDPDLRAQARLDAFRQVKASFVSSEIAFVFELRARAASPAPKKAPGARDY